jgi:putative transcriptional regulator
MKIQAGMILQSSPLLDDLNFQQAIILITEHDDNGATGVVINKLFPRTLNALEEFKHSPAFPLYGGGPVDNEHLFFIHCRPDIIKDGTPVKDNIFFGGNFKQAVAHINDRTIGPKEIKIFVGYCGWGKDELEEEIAEGSWKVKEENSFTVF